MLPGGCDQRPPGSAPPNPATVERMPDGRPPKLDQVLRTRRRDGATVDVTIADHIIEAMRLGDYIESAAQSAGVDKRSVYEWMRVGADLSRRMHRATERGIRAPKATAHEKRCLEFSHAIAQATEEWHLATIGTLEQMARGGRTIQTTTEKRAIDATTGVETVVERTVRTEVLQPSIQAIEWRLRHRFPKRYSERLEVTGAEGGPIELSIEERAAGLASQLRAYLDGVDDADTPSGAPSDDQPAEVAPSPRKGRRGPQTAPQDA